MALVPLKTLAQFRDTVRRHLEIQAPVDIQGNSGDAPSLTPDPSNPVINEAINEAIATVNRLVRLGSATTRSLAISGQSATVRGIQFVDISAVVANVNALVEIEHVWFTSKGGDIITLQPYSYYAPTKGHQPYPQQAPGRPSQFVLAGNQIGILPPSNIDGTVTFSYLSGMNYLFADTDQIVGVPYECQWAVVYWACYLLCAQKSYNVDYQARGQVYQQLARETVLQNYIWKNGYTEEGVASIRKTLQMYPLELEKKASGSNG